LLKDCAAVSDIPDFQARLSGGFWSFPPACVYGSEGLGRLGGEGNVRALRHALYKGAETVMVLLMMAMFIAFIVQIGSRYVFNAPVEWAYEIILITWLWAVFWGAAFLLEDKDHVKFDVIYNMGSERLRRAYALIAALVLAICFLVSLPATWGFISFKAIRSSDMLGIRLDLLFSVYLVFLVATVVHYLLRAWRLMRGHSLAELEKEESL
jgi:TRAP-type C4-dicarboxylate transport system permease small subunit